MLKSEVHLEAISDNLLLKKYIIQNYRTWYAYAKDSLGLRTKVEPKGLVVVNGWVKTTADWALAAFANTVSPKRDIGDVVGVISHGTYTSRLASPTVHRQGKHYFVNLPARVKRDQCIFLSYYKLEPVLGTLLRRLIRVGLSPPPREEAEDMALEDEDSNEPYVLELRYGVSVASCYASIPTGPTDQNSRMIPTRLRRFGAISPVSPQTNLLDVQSAANNTDRVRYAIVR